jgi:uncharacterized protein
MKYPLYIACALSLSMAGHAADTPAPAAAASPPAAAAVAPSAHAPSKESIEKLLTAMNVESLVSNMQIQLDAAMKAGLDRSLKSQVLTPDERAITDNLKKKITADLSGELSWDKMKTLYTQVYSETFTQEEIDGLTKFYESAAGKAFVSKVPQVMKKTMVLMQARMGPVIQNLEKSIQDAGKEIEAQKRKDAAAARSSASAATPAGIPSISIAPAPTPTPTAATANPAGKN